MITRIAEKTVVLTRDGIALTIMERPEGLGTIEDFHKEAEEARRQYGNLLGRQSMDDYFVERHLEAERE